MIATSPFERNSANQPSPRWLRSGGLLRAWYLLVLLGGLWTKAAQETAFHYNGDVSASVGAVAGNYDFQFALFEAETGGTQIGTTTSVTGVPVSQGKFHLLLDFENADLFANAVWIRIAYRVTGSGSAFTTIAVRDPVYPAAQALFAQRALTVSANGIGTTQLANNSVATAKIADSAITGAKIANATITAAKIAGGAGSGLDADSVDGLTSAAFWQKAGNLTTVPGTDFVGTRDNQALEFKVNNIRALRIDPNSSAANFTAGSPTNKIEGGAVGAVISGGGVATEPNRIMASYAAISGGQMNTIQTNAYAANIAGGRANLIDQSAAYSTISGGRGNIIQTNTINSSVGGGLGNIIKGSVNYSVISGGISNIIESSASYTAVNGGRMNFILAGAQATSIAGGAFNVVQPGVTYATIGGGRSNLLGTNASYATIGGGSKNAIQYNAKYSTIGGGEGNIIESSALFAVINGGQSNLLDRAASFAGINGGELNVIGQRATYTSILGGKTNVIQSDALYSWIGGGGSNSIFTTTDHGIILGGFGNVIQANADYGLILGGISNVVSGKHGIAAGRRAKATHLGSTVLSDSTDADFASTANDQFSIRANGGIRLETGAQPLSWNGSAVLSAASALDASKVTTGTLPDARLATTIARVTDVNSSSNSLIATINALTAQLNTVAANLAVVSNTASAMPGATFASTSPNDAGFVAQGLKFISTIPAPAWSSSLAAGVPSGRTKHSTTWTGQEMIVWGGNLASGLYSGSGGIYRPEIDTWTPVSTAASPSARSGHSAVWTGSELLVWGGFSGSTYLNTGGQYSLVNQGWRSFGTAGSPVPRAAHVAVWTGSRMLISGGQSSSIGVIGDNFLYDPVARTWAAIGLSGGPAARYGATAVWTGNRAIIWGGEGASDYLNSGGRLLFNAGGDSATAWSATSVTGAPSARSGHTAIWTGSRMIIWGGSRNGVFLGDGASYDPVADVWTALPALDAPTARGMHTAIWTGSEMVVYGGETAAGAASTGAAYDPAANRWRSLGNPGTRQARSDASAIWTGSEMILFGGRASGVQLAALQRVAPQPAWYLYRKP